ncbi:MAG: Ig-like domain-containing protein [Clostridium sp.]|nr:MAG: Ig-like domain-containing protein [Clostridium sp.]
MAGTLNLSVEITPTNATNKNIYWSVNNVRVATINQSGILTGIKEGEVVVTASAKDGSGIKATKTIKIIDINKEEGNGETIINNKDNNQNQSSTENPKTGISNLTAVLLSCLFITVTLFILSKKT